MLNRVYQFYVTVPKREAVMMRTFRYLGNKVIISDNKYDTMDAG